MKYFLTLPLQDTGALVRIADQAIQAWYPAVKGGTVIKTTVENIHVVPTADQIDDMIYSKLAYLTASDDPNGA